MIDARERVGYVYNERRVIMREVVAMGVGSRSFSQARIGYAEHGKV